MAALCGAPKRWSAPVTKEHHMLDLFYVAIGLAGLIALWGLTKAFERI
jgi:uncharacterized membrane protein YuzA (DUF378 family)